MNDRPVANPPGRAGTFTLLTPCGRTVLVRPCDDPRGLPVVAGFVRVFFGAGYVIEEEARAAPLPPATGD